MAGVKLGTIHAQSSDLLLLSLNADLLALFSQSGGPASEAQLGSLTCLEALA